MELQTIYNLARLHKTFKTFERAVSFNGNGHGEAIEIITKVAEMFNTSYIEVISNSRLRNITDARHISMLLVKERFPLITYNAIGKLFNRHHSSVIYAIPNAMNLIQVDKNLFNVYNTVKSKNN